MNDSELDPILKKAQRPKLPEGFWEEFPGQITRRLHRAHTETQRPKQYRFPRLAWGLATAVCVLVAFAIGHWRGKEETRAIVLNDVLQNPKFISETLAMFPNQVRAIEQDKHGLNLILSEKNDVPVSPPIYVRACDGTNCFSCVTFSGQEIQIAGQNMTVLSDAHGGIILTGNRFIWADNGRVDVDGHLKISAKNLGMIPM